MVKVLLIIMIVSFKNFITSYDTIKINNNYSDINFSNLIYYYISNDDKKLNPDSFINYPEKYSFFKIKSKNINLGYSKLNCWIKFHIRNEKNNP